MSSFDGGTADNSWSPVLKCRRLCLTPKGHVELTRPHNGHFKCFGEISSSVVCSQIIFQSDESSG